VPLTTTAWEPNIGPMVIRDEMCTTQQLLQNYIGCFAFNLKELGRLKGQEVRIILEDENPIFKRPSEVERALV